MKNIEKKIEENINEIFDYKPESGHRQRFEQKLSYMQKPKRIDFLAWTKYAAAAAAIIVIAFLAVKPQTLENENTALNDINIVEVEQYYGMLLDNEICATEKLVCNVDEQYRNELLRDIKLMQNNENNIPDALDDDAKAAVIMLVYTRKIESLQNIQNNLLAHNKN